MTAIEDMTASLEQVEVVAAGMLVTKEASSWTVCPIAIVSTVESVRQRACIGAR
jgi:hypothetical protein